MAAITPVTDSKYAYAYIGNPASDAARLKSLKNAGSLLLAPEHVTVKILPDVWPRDTHAPAIESSQSDQHELFLPGALLDPALARSGLHFAVGGPRLAKLCKDLDDAGMDWTPIYGGEDVAFPMARERFRKAVAALPDDKRLITKDEVWFDGDAEDAATGTWFDHTTAGGLLSGGGSMRLVSHFMALVPGAYTDAAEGGRDSGDRIRE